MDRSRTEKKLFDITERLARARDELSQVNEQLAVLADMADDARVRSLVAETPLASKEYEDAQRHADAMANAHAKIEKTVAELEETQNELLSKMIDGN